MQGSELFLLILGCTFEKLDESMDIHLGWLAVYMNHDSQRILKQFMFIKSGNYKCYCTLQNCGSFNQFSNLPIVFVVVQSLRRVRLFETAQMATCQAFLSFTVSQSLLKPMFIESVILSKLFVLCPLLLLHLVFTSIRIFSSESTVQIRQPEYWSFSISPSSEYSGLIAFRIDWLNLLAVQGILKSLLQHHTLKV